jgi:hypothetical protein
MTKESLPVMRDNLCCRKSADLAQSVAFFLKNNDPYCGSTLPLGLKTNLIPYYAHYVRKHPYESTLFFLNGSQEDFKRFYSYKHIIKWFPLLWPGGIILINLILDFVIISPLKTN